MTSPRRRATLRDSGQPGPQAPKAVVPRGTYPGLAPSGAPLTWRHNPSREGATAYGSHFLGTWDTCLRKGWLTYRAPHPTGGEGLSVSHPSPNLLFGEAIHEGLAAYYQSGWSDGHYDVERATEAFEVCMARRREQWFSAEKYDQMFGLGRFMLRRYYEWYGPGGIDPEYPEIQVARDAEGKPIIEREYSVPVGPSAVYTCRVDLAVVRQDWLCLMEHKTTTRSGVSSLLTSARFDAQFTGEYLVLSKAMGDRPIQGIIVNAMVKDAPVRPGKTPPFVRDYCYRPNSLIEQWTDDLGNRLRYIDQLNDEYDARVAAGMDPWVAARRTYPATGMSNGLCVKFGQPCAFLDLCLSTPHEAKVAESFVPTIHPPREDD